MTEPAPAAETNAAWVDAEIPLPVPALLAFLADSRRLWHLNPCLTVTAWQATDGDGFALSADNDANDRHLDVQVRRAALPDGTGWRFDYDNGLKQSSEFVVAACDGGALLRVTERYAPVDGPDDPRVAESDKSLLPWIVAVRAHLVATRRWGRLPGWQWWTERVMLSMPPRQRRIVRMIVWLTVIEFVIFMAAVLVLRLAV